MSPSKDLPDPGIEPMSLMSPALTGRFFTTSTTWEAHRCYTNREMVAGRVVFNMQFLLPAPASRADIFGVAILLTGFPSPLITRLCPSSEQFLLSASRSVPKLRPQASSLEALTYLSLNGRLLRPNNFPWQTNSSTLAEYTYNGSLIHLLILSFHQHLLRTYHCHDMF